MTVIPTSRFLAILTFGSRSVTFQSVSGGNLTFGVEPSRVPGAKYARKIVQEADLSTITLGVDYEPVGPHNAAVMRALRAAAGDPDAHKLSVKPIDRNGNPFPGEGDTFTGTISGVNRPDSDTNSTSGNARLEVTFEPSNLV